MVEPVQFFNGMNGRSKIELHMEEAYKNLYESEKYLRTIIESSIDGISVVDEHGMIEFGNESFFRIVEWPKEELIGESFIKMLSEDTKKLYLNIWKEAQISESNVEKIAEAKIVTRHGKIKYLYNSRAAMFINGVRKFLFIAKDITEQKKLELKLMESEAKYRDLFENARDAIYVINPEGNFLKMNIVGLKILGCTEEEVIGSNIFKWLTPKSLVVVKDCLKKNPSIEQADQTDVLELVCKNGEHRWVETKTRNIKEGDMVIEIHGIARDVTENMRLHQQLTRSNKQKKLLWYLLQGTRGGKTRALILKELIERPCNANQLAQALNMDYKTIRHHLFVLMKNGIITMGSNGCTSLYYLSKNMQLEIIESDLELFHKDIQ